MIFTEIPTTRPLTPLLDQVVLPQDLQAFEREQLDQLAAELRAFLLYTVGQTGGHFGAGLGVVELTIALHYVLQLPEDRLVWDVGHQAYPHKILTGRREFMHTLRQKGGLKGFPSRSESPYDAFGVGHSSTSISAALGMALALALQGKKQHAVAVIGDGAMTAGMAFEALNHAAHCRANLLVVLNDNRMSISENVGGLSNYFARIWSSRTYNALRESGKKVLENMPSAMSFARKTEEHMKGLVSPGTLFEELGFNYIGPINGHDLQKVIDYLLRIKDLSGPQLLHVVTQKGKGFKPAEDDPVGYHALNKLERLKTKGGELVDERVKERSACDTHILEALKLGKKQKYSNVFGQWLCEMAGEDERIVGITPAMCEGSGMVTFAKAFADRYFDVAIAEQHCVTLAAGMACEGLKPVVAIYSTFLQRAYDQLIHDVALQNLDVLFAIDRAGLVGQDGPTHAGSFDISYLRCIPNMVVMTPSNELECRNMLYTGYLYPGPAAVRYPRGEGIGALSDKLDNAMRQLVIGKAIVRRRGKVVALLAFGSMVNVALKAAHIMGASVVDMRFVKPLDESVILNMVATHDLLVTVEENAVTGGAGSVVNEFLVEHACLSPCMNLGLPDAFVEHGTPEEMLAECGLTAEQIVETITNRLYLMQVGHTAGEVLV